jgi:hypothetical protein
MITRIDWGSMPRSLAQTLAGLAAAACLTFELSPSAQAGEPTTLVGSVGPKATIALRTSDGRAIKRLKAGVFVIVVSDRSRVNNFHVRGPGISPDRRTGVRFVGRVTWRLRLVEGRYAYFSDRHPVAMRGSFIAS